MSYIQVPCVVPFAKIIIIIIIVIVIIVFDKDKIGGAL